MTARHATHLPASARAVVACLVAWAAFQTVTPAAAQDTPSTQDTRLDLPSDDTARAVVRASETASISSELNARITYLPAREGDRFKTGDLLISFDCRRIAAERDAAAAAMKANEAAYNSQLKLLEYKSTGTAAVEQALHQLEKSKAELRGFDIQVQSCQIFAPFDGRMIEKAAQVEVRAWADRFRPRRRT